MKYYIFETKFKSDQCRARCLEESLRGSSEEYKMKTSQWSDELVRQDGKFVVPYCDKIGDDKYIVETYDSSWFVEPQEV